MKDKFLKTVAVAGAIAALTVPAHAVPITGVIGFDGEATLNGPTTASSSEVISWGANTIGITSGTFASLSSAAAVALTSPWLFNSTAVNDFWTVTDGGNTYTFNLMSSYVAGTTAESVTVALIGTVISNVVGLSPTTFNGLLTVQDPAANNGGVFNYTESMSFGADGPTVPDGGSTALLLGAVFGGLALIKRESLTPLA